MAPTVCKFVKILNLLNMKLILLKKFCDKVRQFEDTLDPIVDEAALHAIDAMEGWIKTNAGFLDCECMYDIYDEYESRFDLYDGCAEECEDDDEYDETDDDGGESECEEAGEEDSRMVETIDRFVEFCFEGEFVYTIESGFPSLDEAAEGFSCGKVTVVASRPGIGTTAFGLSVAVNVMMKRHYQVAYFSMDKSSRQLTERLVMAAGRLCGDGAKGVLAFDRTQVGIRLGERESAPLYIDDTRNLSLEDFKSKAETLVRDKDVRLIIVDTLDLFGNSDFHLHNADDMEARMRCLHAVANLGVPVIALAHLNYRKRQDEMERPWFCGLGRTVANYSDEIILLHRDGETWGEDEVAKVMIFKEMDEQCWQKLLCYDADGCCFRELKVAR